MRYAGLTDIGKKRSENQDRIILCPEAGLFAVSDGMGGLPRGSFASDYVLKALPALVGSGFSGSEKEAEELLSASVCLMSDRLYEAMNSRSFVTGATLCGVYLAGKSAVCVNLGDSRAYLLKKRSRHLTQLTEDMNMAGLLVKLGEMTKEEAAGSPEASVLNAFVGMMAPALPEITRADFEKGDRLLICTDGLYSLVPEKDIIKIMRSSRSEERVCSRLIEKANEKGGRDNISAVILRI